MIYVLVVTGFYENDLSEDYIFILYSAVYPICKTLSLMPFYNKAIFLRHNLVVNKLRFHSQLLL